MLDSSLRPFSIRIFVPNGDPDGLRIVEKSNWTWHAESSLNPDEL